VQRSVGDTAKAGARAIQGQLKPFGLLDPGKARLISELEGESVTAPASIGGIAARLQSVHEQNEATVLVEKYKQGRHRLFVVYVPGTRDKTLLPSSDPFDLSDAVALLANPDQAASQRAVLDAMHRAGINSTDQLLMVGYSQGGTIAGDIAQGHLGYKVSGLVTFGAPIAQLDLPHSIPVMAVEHSNDIVPALSGKVNPLTSNWLTVEREVPTAFGELNLHAHRMSEYVSTAGQVDVDGNGGVQRIREQVMKLFDNYKLVDSTNYQYER
jgi:pimeloyl-ACP methyl ester carboxylesterase